MFSSRLKPISIEPRRICLEEEAFHVLDDVIERALTLTRCYGAAVALADAAGFVCRASAGGIAPPIGTRLDSKSGISGACVRTGHLLRCDDPESDPYVDRESCHRLGIRSVIAAPIVDGTKVVGVIEVLSRKSFAFTAEDCSVLKELAALISSSPITAGRKKNFDTTSTSIWAMAHDRFKQGTQQPTQAPIASRDSVSGVPSLEPRTQYDAESLLGSELRKYAPLPSGLGLLMLAVILLGLGNFWKITSSKNVSAEVRSSDDADLGFYANASNSDDTRVDEDIRQLRQQAQRGDADAQFQLATKYAVGEGVPKDYVTAVGWFHEAADKGHVLAADALGAYYLAGRGVSQNQVTAYMWSAIAQSGGDETSKYRVAILRSRMSPTDTSQAEQLAAQWLQAHPNLLSLNKTEHSDN